MIFPTDPLRVPRHPSQLYEALGEGIILGAFLWWLQALIARRAAASGQIRDGYLTAAFLIGYGALRFLVEFTRQPDQQLGYVLGPFSMGQILSTLTILAGLVLLDISQRRVPRTDVSVRT